MSLTTLTPAHRKRLKRYWVDPQTLEPSYVTYQLELYVMRAPTSQKHVELSFGEKLYYDQRYPTALQLAQELSLDGKQVNLVVYPGGFYRITSLTTYADAAVASAQINQLWEHGRVAAAHSAKHIVWAIAGLREVETGYFKAIALCGNPPIRPQDRDQFLAAQAFTQTLIHALDVEGYAAANPWEAQRLSREELLETLHYQRRQSPYLPPPTRAESDAWLRTNAQADIRPYVQPIIRKLETQQAQLAQEIELMQNEQRKRKAQT